MKPRWKTIVELVISTCCMFISASLMTANAVWPPQLPEWLLFGLGFFSTIVFLRLMSEKWAEL